MAEPTPEVLQDLHRRMVRIRRFEEACGRLSEAGRLPGFLHLYVGEEAVAAGVCANLTDEDKVTSTHRGHGHLIAKGGDFTRAFAELMGRESGYCRGRGGSMHISDLDLGMLGANGIVGAGVPIAVGAGFANKYRDNGNVSVPFFGDGASNIGAFHEAANMAAALKLPVVFVCENNGYGEFTPRERTQAITDVADRAIGYGMPGVVVDGMDAVAVWEAAHEAVERARRGDGPSFIEAKTYRYFDHHGIKGLGVSYRSDDEVAQWKQKDAIEKIEAQLREASVLDDAGIRAVHDAVQAEIDQAIETAEAGPFPDPAELLAGVYTEVTMAATVTEPETETRTLSYGQAFNEAVAQLMRDDDSVFVAGEDVAGYGGVFRTFAGLLGEFGPRRVVDTPISEQAIVGLGTGAAVSGLRPIVDIMFMDFMGVAMDQIVNQAAKLKFMFGGTATVPLTITTWAGAGLGAAAQHSQSLEAWLCHIPGLRVVFPSSPHDMKGLMIAAVREPNPVVVIGGKRMLGDKGPVPEEMYEIPLGSAEIKRPGSDVTVVAVGRMVGEALKAAESLAGDGIECEVIDPRTLQPFDSGLVVESVGRTHRAVVAHEAVRFCGLGAEVAAQIQELAFDELDAPVGRVGAPFAPVPFSPGLERAYVPDAAAIADAVRATVGAGD